MAAAEVGRLVRAAQGGDGTAFRRLVETHARAVYAVAYRLMRDHADADDIAQETFVRAYEALDRYDEQYRFTTWLRTIATRLAWNELQKRKRRRTEAGEAFENAAEVVGGHAPDAAEEASHGELERRFAAALEAMPAEHRAVLALRVQEDMSYEEIATALGIPVGTVMSRLSRGRAWLRRAWGIAPDPKGAA
jgi:RNA polymerase sigma-70 factor (ECF subfamily)